WAGKSGADRVLIRGKPARSAPKPAKLLARILADPSDDDARRVYADALTEAGDPRGELITVQYALATAKTPSAKGALRKREKQLLKKYGRTWTQNAMQDATDCEIRRGFVARVTMTGAAWATKGARLFAHDPIEEL